MRRGDIQRAPLTPRVRPARIPLSYGQQRLWLVDRLQGSSVEYNQPIALRLRGPLNRTALTRALEAIVARHEALRTHFPEVDDEPAQVIEPEGQLVITSDIVRSRSHRAQCQAIRAMLEVEWSVPFNLSTGPLLRVRLLTVGADDHVLILTFHHIITDRWSQGVFNRELSILYGRFRRGDDALLTPLPLQYADYALWQRERLDDERVSDDLGYWARQLAGAPTHPQVPGDRPQPSVRSLIGGVCQRTLSVEHSTVVKQFSLQSRVTPYMLLLAVFAVLLARHGKTDDILIGSPISNRSKEQLEVLIGFFVNTLILRVDLRRARTFSDVLAQVRHVTLGAYEHHEVPFERLVEFAGRRRSLSMTPACQVMFAMQNTPWVQVRLPGLHVHNISSDVLKLPFDLKLYVSEVKGRLVFQWFYSRDLFSRAFIEQLARRYEALLERLPLEANGQWVE